MEEEDLHNGRGVLEDIFYLLHFQSYDESLSQTPHVLGGYGDGLTCHSCVLGSYSSMSGAKWFGWRFMLTLG